MWILRLYIPPLDALLKQIDFTVAFGGDKILPMPGGYLLPALAVGMLTRIYRLHARISDWLGIRECFDLDVIIAEFAAQLGIDLTLIPEEHLIEVPPRHHAAGVLSVRQRPAAADRPTTDPAGARRLVAGSGSASKRRSSSC